MTEKGNLPINIKPFPVGQGNPLPDAVQAHISGLWLVSTNGLLVGFESVLFLVCNTGADILISNNILDQLGILSYHPPEGYENILRKEASNLPTKQASVVSSMLADQMIRSGTCLVTTKGTATNSKPCAASSKEEKPGISASENDFKTRPTRQEQRDQRAAKIEAALQLQVGRDPPLKEEISRALSILKQIAENPLEPICLPEALEAVRKELSCDRPEWSECLTAANTLSTPVEAADAKKQIEEMMDGRFKETVFAKTLAQPCNFPPMEIKTRKDALPERSKQPRRFKDPKITQLIDDWVEGLLKDKLIQPSTTPVASPVTVVLKPNREPRVCIDYRERNSRTETPIYPMPDVHDFLDDAAGFNLYCSFDCAKMFHQYEIVPEHRHLAAFMTQKGTFEPSRILFGLTGGPQHAVRSVRPALKEHDNTNGKAFTRWALEQNTLGENPPYPVDEKTGIVPGSCLDIFVDDCRISANKPKAMVKLCELWFLFCEEKRLILSRKKAKICLTYLPLLGFVVSSRGKHLDPARISSLLNVTRPNSKEGLHALLCSYNFVRMFVPNFSSIAAPLYSATKGIVWKGPGSGRSKGTRDFDPSFAWTETMDRSLRQLQNSLLESPILSIPDYSKPLYLSVDASLKGEGWVLWQILEREGQLIPVAIHYGSLKYGEAESTWEVTRQEAHAILSALDDVHDYIFFCHFFLFTDHRNLTFLSDSVNRAVIRIRQYMSSFNMTVVHVPGNWNNPADGLSRLEDVPLLLETTRNISSVSCDSHGNFFQVNRGTDPIPSPFILEDTDRILSTSASVLFTTSLGSCTNLDNCLLCNLQMEGTEDMVAQVLCTETREYIELDQTNSYDPSPPPEELDWEVVEQIHRNCFDAQLFLTRSEARQEATEWNSKLLKSVCSESPYPEADSEWFVSEVHPTSKTFPYKGSYIPFQDPHYQSPIRDGNVHQALSVGPETAKPIPVDVNTQTSPADFRAMKLDLPNVEDFRSIHNNEEGHHGLAFSYRKLMVKFGPKWIEDKESLVMIKRQLKQFIDHCPICQKIRGLQETVKAKHSFIVCRPFTEVSYDFIVFEKPDKLGHRYLIVAVDNFTKLTEFKPTPTRAAEGVALFLIELKSRYGPINRLRSDREKAFTSLVLQRYNELTGTSAVPCVPYHPQANSICERQNQIIMNHLRALVYGTKLGTESAYSWSDLLPFVYSIVNNTPKLPLAISPLSMVYGVFANYDQHILAPRVTGQSSDPVEYVDGLMEWQTRLIELSEEIQSRHYSKLTLKSDGKRCFQEGDFVLQLKNSTGLTGKLLSRWIGPRLVLARRNNDPSHPLLDLLDLVSSKVIEASIEDCRLLKTGWFEEATILQDLRQLAALDKEEYEVESILDHKPPGSQRPKGAKPTDYWFKVKWAGFSDEENSWEPYSQLKDLQPLEDYLLKFPKLKL